MNSLLTALNEKRDKINGDANTYDNMDIFPANFLENAHKKDRIAFLESFSNLHTLFNVITERDESKA